MVGFWDSIAARPRGKDSPGPGQPLPDIKETSYTWPQEMQQQKWEGTSSSIGNNSSSSTNNSNTNKKVKNKGNFKAEMEKVVGDESCATLIKVSPCHITKVWEPISGDLEDENSSISRKPPPYDACFQGF